MSFKINYKLNSDEIIRNLELISKTDGHLQVLRMNPSWSALLENRARIEEAVSSIGIEGTVLTIDQANAITVDEKSVQVGEKEKREFLGYMDSLKFIKGEIDSVLTKSLLLNIHSKITVGDMDAKPGTIRNDLRAVKRHGHIIYKAPPPNQLNFLLDEFIAWFNTISVDKNFSPIVAAAICHFWFVWIHPFCDGNGRVARLLTTFLLLKKKSEGIRYFALSDYYNRDKNGYYDSLQHVNNCDPNVPSMNFDNDISVWISYFINSYLVQMDGIKQISNRILQLNIRIEDLRHRGLITDRGNRALLFLSSRERASYAELKSYLEVSKPRVNQILKPLREAKILTEKTIGKTVWFSLGAPEDDINEEPFIKKKLNNVPKKMSAGLKNKDRIQGVLPIFD